MSRILSSALALLLLALAPAGAATLRVGPDQLYRLPSQAIAAAHDGDTVAIAPGTYTDCAIVRRNHLTIEGTGPGATLTGPVCAGKALLVIDGSDDVIGDLTLEHAADPSGNGAGIRAEGGSLTVVAVTFRNDQDGILTAPNPRAILRVEDSSFIGDGTCVNQSGCAHAIYANAMTELEVSHSRFLDTQQGHNIKSRAALTVVTHAMIEDGPDGTSSYQIDLPNGGNLRVDDTLMQKGPHSGNHSAAIMIGEEGLKNPTTSLILRDNTVINNTGHPTVFVHSLARTPVTLIDNSFTGGTVIAQETPTHPRPVPGLWQVLLTPHKLAALVGLMLVGAIGMKIGAARRRRFAAAGGVRVSPGRAVRPGALILAGLLTALVGAGPDARGRSTAGPNRPAAAGLGRLRAAPGERA